MLETPENTENIEKNTQTTPQVDKFNTYSGIDDLINEMDKPKQVFTPKSDGSTENIGADGKPEIPITEVEIIPPAQKAEITAKAKRSAEFLTKIIDKGLAWGAMEVANADDSKGFRADNEAISELSEYWAEILKDMGGNIPPWVMLCITYPLVYGPLYREAFKARRINKAILQRAIDAEAKEIIANEQALKNKEALEAIKARDEREKEEKKNGTKSN